MDVMRMAQGGKGRSPKDTTRSASQGQEKKSEILRNTLGSISQKFDGGGYIPKKWIVEETGQDSFSVTNRITGDILADGFLHHRIASKLVKMLNEGSPVNESGPATLLGLNLEFESLIRETAKQGAGADTAQTVKQANAILDRIDGL